MRKLYRLKKREPSIPRVDKKQPIFFDSRIGKIEMSENSKSFKFWARISTLHKGERIEIPLHIYPYAERHLKNWEIKSFQMVYNYRLKRWEVHVVVKKEKDVKIKNVAGIDLGIKRPAVMVKIGEDNRVVLIDKREWRRYYQRLHELNNRIAKLQRQGKIKMLKKMREKRKNLLLDMRRKMAKKIGEQLRDTLVFVGNPRYIREENYKGNGKRKARKMVNRWAFREFGTMIIEKIRENDGDGVWVGEYWTTHKCPICGSKNVEVNDRHFKCRDCGFEGDRDVVGSANILLKGLTKSHVSRKTRMVGAVVNQPEAWMTGLKKSLNTQSPTTGVS